MHNPFANNTLRTRADVQQAVRDLFAPLKSCFSSGAARVKVGHTSAHFDDDAAELEGFSRPLWGIVPLVAGGGHFADWDLYHRGLANGADPDHPEYWGMPGTYDQRLVEMAAIGVAMLMLPEQVWQPLSTEARRHLADWLRTINTVEVVDNNWRWFRVLVNLGLKAVGEQHDASTMAADLDRLDAFYLGNGWYTDGDTPQRDYYVPFGMHYYGLLYATYAREDDPARTQRYRKRARLFAQDFAHWFAGNGAALPFGRSLTYRFAQGSFWGALASANIEGLPWGVMKGLYLRHLRYWSQQPIFNNDGTLSIGYSYPNLNMAEQYNSPGSPYWAMKAFLPLALPASHPFWQAEELPLSDLPSPKYQPHPRMILMRDASDQHVIALSGGQSAPWALHGGEKYAKFAYSTAFGFSVPVGKRGLPQAAADSMLALSDDGEFYRVREQILAFQHDREALYARWQPLPGVTVETWLLPQLPWHLRVHRVQTDKTLWTAEGAFAIDRTGDHPLRLAGIQEAGTGFALANFPAGASGIRDLQGQREGQVVRMEPNSNLVAPRTLLPTLTAQLNAGEHWLACAVLASTNLQQWQLDWAHVPDLPDLDRFSQQDG